MAPPINNIVSVDAFVTSSNVDLAAHNSTGTKSTNLAWTKNTAPSLTAGGATVSHANSDVFASNANNTLYLLADDPLSPDYAVYANLTVKSIPAESTAFAGICFRADSSTNTKYSLLYLLSSAANEWIISCDSGGNSTTIGTPIVTSITQGHIYSLELVGKGSTIVGVITDITSTPTQVGVISGTDTTISVKGNGGVTFFNDTASDSTGLHISNYKVVRYIRVATVGDSITEGAGSSGGSANFASTLLIGDLQTDLPAYEPGFIGVNEGQAGADTSDYLPNSNSLGTTDPNGGVTKNGTTAGASNNPYHVAITTLQAAGHIDIISIMLGTNDSKNSQATTQSQYLANMGTIVSGFLAAFPGVRIVIQPPIWVSTNNYGYWDPVSSANTLELAYQSAILSLVANDTTHSLWMGSTKNFTDFENNSVNASASNYYDGIHPNNTGHILLAHDWAFGVEAAILGAPQTMGTLIHSTDWTTGSFGSSSTGGAGSTTGAGDGWIDLLGGTATVSSNLLHIVGDGSFYTDGGGVMRPASESSSVRDQQMVVTFPASLPNSGSANGISDRYLLMRKTGSNTQYLIGVAYNSGSVIQALTNTSGGLAVVTGTITPFTAPTTSDILRLTVSITGASPSTITATLYDVTTSTTLATFSVTDSTAGLQVAGQMGLAASNGNTTSATFSTAATYNLVAATSYTSSESASSGGVNSAVTITYTPNGNSAATITPAFSGAGMTGTFSPTTVSFDGTSSAKTVTFTPTAVGTATLTSTNSGSLTDPSSLTYTSVVTPVTFAADNSSIRHNGPYLTGTGVSETISSGNTIEIPFTSTSGTGTLTFDVSIDSTNCIPDIKYSLDGGAWSTRTPAAASVPFTIPASGSHVLRFMPVGIYEGAGGPGGTIDEWNSQQGGLKWTGGTLPSGATIGTLGADPGEIEFLGDSITASVRLLGTLNTDQHAMDSQQAWPYLTGTAIGLNQIVRGYGGTGLTVSGNGGVPKTSLSFPYVYASHTYTPASNPKAVVLLLGTNDQGASVASSTFQAAYQALISQIRAARGSVTPIICIAPPACAAYVAASAFQNAITAVGDANVHFLDASGTNVVDTTGSDSTDGTHFSVTGGQKFANWLVPHIVTLAGLGATAFTMTGPTTGNVGAPSSVFTITPTGGPYTGTITPSDNGAGGTFTPSSLTWSNSAVAKTFQYTAPSAATYSISAAASPTLTTPTAIAYVASGVSLAHQFGQPTSATVVPANITMLGSDTAHFQAYVNGTGLFTQGVTWTTSAGTIVANGTFASVLTAPAGSTSGAQTVTVTATSKADSSVTATATVTVLATLSAAAVIPSDVATAANAEARADVAALLTLGTATGAQRLTTFEIWHKANRFASASEVAAMKAALVL